LLSYQSQACDHTSGKISWKITANPSRAHAQAVKGYALIFLPDAGTSTTQLAKNELGKC
jgi:hypothetical protein